VLCKYDALLELMESEGVAERFKGLFRSALVGSRVPIALVCVMLIGVFSAIRLNDGTR